MLDICELVEDIIDKLSKTDEGLRNLLLGNTEFSFEYEISNIPGLYKLERKGNGSFHQYKLDISGEFLTKKVSCEKLYYTGYIIDNKADTTISLDTTSGLLLAVAPNISFTCNINKLLLAGDYLLDTLKSNSSLYCNSCSVYYQDISNELHNNLTILYLMVSGLLIGEDKGLYVKEESQIYLVAFTTEECINLINQLNKHIELLKSSVEFSQAVITDDIRYKNNIRVLVNYDIYTDELKNEYDKLVSLLSHYYDLVSIDAV